MCRVLRICHLSLQSRQDAAKEVVTAPVRASRGVVPDGDRDLAPEIQRAEIQESAWRTDLSGLCQDVGQSRLP